MTPGTHLSWGGFLAFSQTRLAPETQQRYEGHLRACQPCQRRFRWVQNWLSEPEDLTEDLAWLSKADVRVCREQIPLLEKHPELLLRALHARADSNAANTAQFFTAMFQHLVRCYPCFSSYAHHARLAYPDYK